MPAHNILVVVVDGLRASALGAYGNTSFPTPALDRFAAESLLLDWCYARSIDLAEIYSDLWQAAGWRLGGGEEGEPTVAAVPSPQSPAPSLPTSLLRQIKSHGYATTLVTDDPRLAIFPATADFHHCLQLGESSNDSLATATAGEIAQTSLARLFAAAADVVASTTSSPAKFVWLHSRGMYGPWDAPLYLQQSLLDEGDPSPVESVTPPDFAVAQADDPDAAFRFSSAYAAQAMVLDECWESLLDAVNAAGGGEDWLIGLLGARGFPLGEHHRIGGIDPRLYGEQLHVPCLIRFPDAVGRLARNNQLATHLDISASIVESTESANLCALAATAARAPSRDALISTSPLGHRAIRTADWCLRRNPSRVDELASEPAGISSPDIELFVRPDDRWEANDVAKLCWDAVESLVEQLDDSR